MPAIGAFAVITNNAGEVLCVKHAEGDQLWGTSGSWLGEGETPHDALLRGLKQDLGIANARVGEMIGAYVKPYADDVVLGFRVEVPGLGSSGRVTPQHDLISQADFFAPTHLPLPMSAVTFAYINDGLAERQGQYRLFPQRRLLRNKVNILTALSELGIAA